MMSTFKKATFFYVTAILSSLVLFGCEHRSTSIKDLQTAEQAQTGNLSFDDSATFNRTKTNFDLYSKHVSHKTKCKEYQAHLQGKLGKSEQPIVPGFNSQSTFALPHATQPLKQENKTEKFSISKQENKPRPSLYQLKRTYPLYKLNPLPKKEEFNIKIHKSF